MEQIIGTRKSVLTNSRLLVLLLTSSFPFGDGEQFLETEIRYLAQAPLDVRIAPVKMLGTARPLPAGVTVEESLARWRGGRARRLLRAATALPDARGEIAELVRRWPRRSWPKALKRLTIALDEVALSAKWLDRTIQAKCWEQRPLIVYTYWFTGATCGAVQLKRKYPRMKVVTRAHGSDLYAESYDPPYMPLRQATLARIDQVFAVSEHGRSYLLNHAGAPSEKVVVAPLGVDDPGPLAATSNDGVVRVFSCSTFRPVKRLDLLVRSLVACAALHPERAFHWTHIGDGPLRSCIQRLAMDTAPRNLTFRFPGHVDNHMVLEHYRSEPIDVFVNVSRSEGLPVSIMEAQSFGVPVVATAVGGVPEIVNQTTGELLDASPDPVDVARAIWRVVQCQARVRPEIKLSWRERFFAEEKYHEFAQSLYRLASSQAGEGAQAG